MLIFQSEIVLYNREKSTIIIGDDMQIVEIELCPKETVILHK